MRSGLAAYFFVGVLLTTACRPSPVSSPPAPRPSMPPAGPATSTAEPPPLLHLTSESGKYEVQLPVSEGIVDYSVSDQILGRSIGCHVTFSRLDYAFAVVEYCDLPPEAAADLAPDAVLAQTRTDLLRPFRVQVTSEQPSLADDMFPSMLLSGRVDMRGFGDDGDFEARIILADRRVFVVLMAASDSDQCGCITLKSQVVYSFHAVPDLSIPFEPTP